MGSATTAPITFSAETFSDVMDEADQLGRAHWRELYGDTMPYPAEPEKVAALERAGAFAYFAARNAEGRLVGQIGFFLLYSPVHAQHLALDAFYYVDPAHRRHGTAKKLLRHAGEALTRRGVGTVFVSCLRGSHLGPIIEGAGYERSSSMYCFTGT